mgnify:CR=1 FL=1
MPGRNHAGAAAALVDTNVWVYAHMTAPGAARHGRALALVQSRDGWVIGPQGMAEWQLGGD